jgi:hypothetical protein
MSHLYEHVKDKYYNYIIQKIFEIGEKEHKVKLFEKLKEFFLEFLQDKYGCRVI